MDVVGVQAADALRLLRSGTFDVMSVQIGMASRDDPFFEGIDLIGVSTNMQDLRKAVDAYRLVFDERLQRRFNAKVMTLVAVRAAGLLLQQADQVPRRHQGAEGAQLHAVDGGAHPAPGRDAGDDAVLRGLPVAPARRRRLRRHLADLRQHRQVARGDDPLPAAVGVGLGAGPLHEQRLLEAVHARPPAEDPVRLQADGRPDVGPRRAGQRRRGRTATSGASRARRA